MTTSDEASLARKVRTAMDVFNDDNDPLVLLVRDLVATAMAGKDLASELRRLTTNSQGRIPVTQKLMEELVNVEKADRERYRNALTDLRSALASASESRVDNDKNVEALNAAIGRVHSLESEVHALRANLQKKDAEIARLENELTRKKDLISLWSKG